MASPFRVGVVGALVSALAACGGNGSDLTTGDVATTWTTTAPDIDAARAAAALRAGEVDVLTDFDPDSAARSTQIKRIVVGNVAGFEAGPKLYAEMPDDPWAVPTVVMKVKVRQMLKGMPRPTATCTCR